MSDLTIGRESAGAAARSASDVYRAVWRWHFYAGLMVLPFMITLAITGALYLFKDEIDAAVYSDFKQVELQENVGRTAPSAMVAAALAAHPGTAVKFTDPPSPSSAAEITVSTESEGKVAVYVSPYTGEVLGALPDRGTIMWTIRYLHSLKYFGSFARALIEIAAGWSILLVGTGIYLWWPRRQTGGVLSVRGTPKRRVFWRDTHAVTGLFVGFFIVFLAITGMPWSGVWGDKVNEWANGSNFGYPAGVRVAVPSPAITSTMWPRPPGLWSRPKSRDRPAITMERHRSASIRPLPPSTGSAYIAAMPSIFRVMRWASTPVRSIRMTCRSNASCIWTNIRASRSST